jgi:hypothetical protein
MLLPAVGQCWNRWRGGLSSSESPKNKTAVTDDGTVVGQNSVRALEVVVEALVSLRTVMVRRRSGDAAGKSEELLSPVLKGSIYWFFGSGTEVLSSPVNNRLKLKAQVEGSGSAYGSHRRGVGDLTGVGDECWYGWEVSNAEGGSGGFISENGDTPFINTG